MSAILLRVRSFAVVIPLAISCGGIPVDAAMSQDEYPREPEWLRLAIAESRARGQVSCHAFAPLEIVETDQPLWDSCIRYSQRAAAETMQQEHVSAVAECKSNLARTGKVGCCFTRSTGDVAWELRRTERCESECGGHATKPRSRTDLRQCSPRIVPSDLDAFKQRLRTPAMMELLSRCRLDRNAAQDCESFNAPIQRKYCANLCRQAADVLEEAVAYCVLMAKRGLTEIRCSSEVEPEVHFLCEERCRARVEGDKPK